MTISILSKNSFMATRIFCADGFSISVAAAGLYHARRDTNGVLTHVELGYPEDKGETTYEPLLKKWAREEAGVLVLEDMWNVPVDLLEQVVAKHGGEEYSKSSFASPEPVEDKAPSLSVEDYLVEKEVERVSKVMEPRCQRLDNLVQDALEEAYVLGVIAAQRTSSEYTCRCPYKQEALVGAWKNGFDSMIANQGVLK